MAENIFAHAPHLWISSYAYVLQGFETSLSLQLTIECDPLLNLVLDLWM